MAIDKKLIHFKTKENFISQGVGSEENVTKPTEGSEENGNAVYGQLKGTSIVFIKDSNEIWTHGNLYKSVNWSKLVPPPIKVGDIAYWTGSKIKTISMDKWKSSLGTPVGVVVIPEGFLYDGRARIASLTTVTAHFADTTQVSSMLGSWNGHVFPTTLNDGSTTTGTATNGTFATESSKDRNPSFIDPNSGYSTTDNMVPSPYNGDSVNSSYTTPPLVANRLTHITENHNGEYLTYEHFTASNHSIASTVRAFTDAAGSNLKWYAPTIGELGFLCARNETIGSIAGRLGNWSVGSYLFVLSMSVVNQSRALVLNIDSGGTLTSGLANDAPVIPFAKI